MQAEIRIPGQIEGHFLEWCFQPRTFYTWIVDNGFPTLLLHLLLLTSNLKIGPESKEQTSSQPHPSASVPLEWVDVAVMTLLWISMR